MKNDRGRCHISYLAQKIHIHPSHTHIHIHKEANAKYLILKDRFIVTQLESDGGTNILMNGAWSLCA